MDTKQKFTVFISSKESICDECREDLGSGAWITLQDEKRIMCLECADLDHLIFLPSGDAALTRRAKKHSQLFAVVQKWNRRRKRYERQGLLVEQQAVDRAEIECEADADKREQRRARASVKRAELDREFIAQFSKRIRELYPRCPAGREQEIAQHACLKYSGRVGRSAAAKELDKKAVILSVRAHIRHTETPYDELMMRGCKRYDAREKVREAIDTITDRWQGE